MRGTVTVKCPKGHKRGDKRCGGRCGRRWYYVLSETLADGKRRRLWSRSFASENEARAALTAEVARRDQGIMLSTEKVTVRVFAGRWLNYMVTLGRDERTLERYRELLELHALPAIGGLQLRQLQPIHLSDLYGKLLREGRRDGRPGGLHPRTVGHVHRALHRMLKQAVRWQLIARNPASDLELPSVPKAEMVTLTRDQAAVLLQAADTRPLMRSLGTCGTRIDKMLSMARRWW